MKVSLNLKPCEIPEQTSTFGSPMESYRYVDMWAGPPRFDGTFVLAASPKFKQIAKNRVGGDEGDFNATPAIADGHLYIRSDGYLYAIGNKGQKQK